MSSRWTYLSAALVGGSMLIGQTTLEAQVGPGAAKVKEKSQPSAPKSAAPDAPKGAAKGRDDAKDTKKDARDDAKDRAKDTREDAKDRAKDTKDRSKDTREDAKDRTKGARDDAKDTVRKPDAGRDRDDVKDRAKDTKDRAKDTKETAKDRTRDAKGIAKDRTDDAKDVAKDRAGDAKGGKQARKFDAENVKADDLGLSFEDADDGIAISNVSRDSAFVKAGFRSGDQIVSVADHTITRQQDFVRYLFASDVRDERVPVIVLRDGVRETVYVEPATIIRTYETVVVEGRRNPIRDFGLVVDGRSDDRVYVERVIKDSRADQAGIQVDDEVLAVNEEAVETSKDLSRLLEKFEDERIDMEVSRERQSKVIEVRVIR